MKKTFLYFTLSVLLFASCNNSNQKDVKKAEKIDSAIPVRVTEMKPEVFKHYIETSGNVEAVEWAFITPQINGKVKTVNVEEGDKVKKGQILVVLDDAIIRNNIADLKAQLDLAKVTYKKQKMLWEQKIVSEMAYLQAKAKKESLEKKLAVLREQLGYTKVRAPFDGIVENIQIKTGEIAGPGRKLMQIYNLNELKIKAAISEKYIEKIKEGDTVAVFFDNLSIDTLKLPVYRISNVINPSNRTFDIELRLKNKKHLIKPNMTANLRINDYVNPDAFVVPTPVVKKDFNKEFVFIAVKEKGKYVAKKVFVKSNITYNGMTEIIDGLNEGDLLITEGYNEVAGHSLIKILN